MSSIDLLTEAQKGFARIPAHFAEQVAGFANEVRDRDMAGRPVGLRLANDDASLLALQACWQVGAVPLILPSDCTDAMATHLMQLVDCRMQIRPGATLDLVGDPAGKIYADCCAILLSSGSTGQPKPVFRSKESLLAEALGYIELLRLGPGTPVHLIAPASHAYAFGWLCAGLAAGCTVNLVAPRHLGRALDAFETGGWCAVTPTIARLLCARPVPQGYRPGPGLGVMAGAGPVDAGLQERFQQCFGVPVSRNFGSSETGAVIASLPGLVSPELGQAMPGVALRVLQEDGHVARSGTGRLQVKVGATWQLMSDIVEIREDGHVRHLGREGAVVRRGDHFVATGPAVDLAQSDADLRAARAATVGRTGGDAFALDVWPKDPGCYDAAPLFDALRASLGPDRPDLIRQRIVLKRNDADKIRAAPRYRIAPGQQLDDIARAYKKSHLAFALHRAGVLDMLGSCTVEEIATQLSFDLGALEYALELAAAWGIVEPSDHPARPADTSVLAYEAEVAHGLNAPEAILSALQRGPAPRQPLPPDHAAAYARLHDAPSAALARQLVIRQLGNGPFESTLLVGSGSVAYLRDLQACDTPVGPLRYWPVGLVAETAPTLPAQADIGRPSPEEAFDLAILSNAIHWAPLGKVLPDIWHSILPGGRIVVEDVFLDGTQQSADLTADWLTHGGLSNVYLDDIMNQLVELASSISILPGTQSRLDQNRGWTAFIAQK